jgi:RNA polymerase sigma-54 factor
MQLSIKLLQMNTLEMEQLAQQEMLENPFLEMETPEGESTTESDEKEPASEQESDPLEIEAEDPPPPSPTAKKEETATVSDIEVPEPPPLDSNQGAETFDQVDVEWDDYYDDSGPYISNTREAPEEERDFTEYTASRTSLYDHLLWQLRVSPLEGADFEIGEYLVGNIDGNGYLTMSVEEVAEALGAEPKRVEHALGVIHTFDPTGVGARNLAECLLLQLESRGLTDPIYKAILTEHFHQLGQQKFKDIAKALGVPEERVTEAFHEIRRCDPKPGRSITKETPRYVEPDIYVKKVDSRYLYFLNEGDLRHLRINDYYRSVLRSNDGMNDKEKEYYRDKYRSAVWLIRNIERRKGTILRVTEAIMEFQKDFMDKGPEHVRPLTLKQIAETVGMHEATIARVTANKYVDTPRGVFPLKYFFSSSLDKNDGSDAASSRSVKEMIRKMIAEENPDQPLSDSEITKALTQRGVRIARRTVAKYRDQLKILPANLRKAVNK